MTGAKNSTLRRSTRHSTRQRFRVPNPEHYVGYVKDDETPEMIMKKFEEFDRVLHSSHCDHSEQEEMNDSRSLTEDQLTQVFEATSSFSIREVYEEFPQDLEEDHSIEEDIACNSDEDFQLSDEDSEDEEFEDRAPNGKQRRPQRKERCHMVDWNHDSHVLPLRRKLKERKRSDHVIHLRLPSPPLPASWGRTVKPFGGLPSHGNIWSTSSQTRFLLGEISSASVYQYPDLLSADLSEFYGRFVGVMVNPLWCEKGEDKKQSRCLLQRLPVLQLCPEGFVFIWIPKTFLQTVWEVVSKWGFFYVENLSWVQLQPNNKVRRDQENANWILPRSHLSLYIFRKGGKDIEIKHQRSSDLIFDVHVPGESFQAPEDVYNVIETMLPHSVGKLVELWAGKDALRDGWTHLQES